ncbi:DUF2256 domain-containing protein [Deinococcus enclensis]|uniref:DUF2256 domain-containing protein n=1 Tax=Deinococcus enclensis TaxID=1049582 RepID=A0ABT9MB19_9DEIO|nr:DUF2256 domain-containing protein [Deinococcus enclensis]MDP9763731.1 hypothetical protein [Deinococcus enclensis]
MPRRSPARPAMGGGRPPADRPTKTCPVCGLPLMWRRKWARDWAQVRYCSDRCRARRALAPGADA